MMKIVVLDGYGMNPGDLSWVEMKKLGNVTIYDRTADADIISRCKDAEAILTNKVVLNADTISQLKRLKYIGVLATGFNVIDMAAAKNHGIIVTNIPAYSTESVVQMTFAHILNIVNRVDYYANENRKGRWCDNKDFVYWDSPLHELAGKSIGIVGLGNIGRRVAEVAAAFGMDVSAMTSKNSSDLPDYIRKTTLDGLFAQSEIITLHCPLSESTHAMINADTISMMKDGVILINTGRGPLINEQDVADALSTGKMAAYGTDVLVTEPAAKDNPLLKCRNAFITPHQAWATFEARERLMNIATDNLKAFIAGRVINAVG
jgi:glycerate dehydrogenase